MWDDTILLKIKREFTDNEAVQQLLKMISELEVEIGVLKSERDEAVDMAKKLRTVPTMTKKQWLQEEVFVSVNCELETLRRKYTENKKSFEEWRNKYFSLLAKTGNAKNAPVEAQGG